MDPNRKMWDSIKVLMEQSFWGRSSSITSLSQDLRSEVSEFIQACQNNDSVNVLEEAADIIMMVFCLLYQAADKKENMPDEIANRVTEKLHWRYGHLYQGTRLQKNSKELETWDQAKRIEQRMNLMFCGNQSCPAFRKAGVENIRYEEGLFRCKLCSQEIIPSSSTVLLFRDKWAARYMKEICASIMAYSEGDDNAAAALSIDHPEAFHALCVQLLDTKRNDVLQVFIEYVQRKYCIAFNEVNDYLNCVKDVQKQMKTEGLMEKYYHDICAEKYDAKDMFMPDEWEKIKESIRRKTFDVAKCIKRSIHFHARNWDNQVVHKYLLHYPNRKSKMLIECMTLMHYDKERIRDLTIELSNMYNCIVGCQFCASGALPGEVQFMEALDYVRQLNTCLLQSGINPDDFEAFYVSFAGIGEPSVLYKSIAAGMVMMRDIYPKIQFNIATFGYREECFSYWKGLDLPVRTIQIPLYHVKLGKLKRIVPSISEDYDFVQIVKLAVEYQKNHPMCRVKINYIPMKGMNDSEDDIQLFLSVLEPFKSNVSIKVSFLNYTKPAEENGFVTSGAERLEAIKTTFVGHGFRAYVFGSDKNTALGCGQLAQNNISGSIS